jgi:hypothetical protein
LLKLTLHSTVGRLGSISGFERACKVTHIGNQLVAWIQQAVYPRRNLRFRGNFSIVVRQCGKDKKKVELYIGRIPPTSTSRCGEKTMELVLHSYECSYVFVVLYSNSVYVSYRYHDDFFSSLIKYWILQLCMKLLFTIL